MLWCTLLTNNKSNEGASISGVSNKEHETYDVLHYFLSLFLLTDCCEYSIVLLLAAPLLFVIRHSSNEREEEQKRPLVIAP
jgi:hypothetical protein